jgi:serine/threonine protein kinase
MTRLIAERYRLDQHLSSIDHSEFYNGFDLKNQQSVIVRLIDLDQENQKFLGKLQGFMRNELGVIQKLTNPHAFQILDYGMQETIYYQVNEFVEFKTLRDEMTQTPCDLQTALRYGRDLADILAEFHTIDLIHCDIKPEHILVTDSGIKLMEFLIANHTIPEGTITGTPVYMSPEAIQNAPLSAVRDIWALGIVLYELIAGGPPFRLSMDQSGPGQMPVLLMKILQEPVPLIEESVANLPPRLVTLIHAMLEKDPGTRIADMSYVARELDAILSQFSI